MKKTREEKDLIYIKAMKAAVNLYNDSDFADFMALIRDMREDVDAAYADAIGEATHKLQGRKKVLDVIIESVEDAPEHLATMETKRSQRKEVKKDGVHSHFT
jgi:acyl-CoA reductase-like NAD-dependent aldehyde dehydrogenase